MLTYWIMFLVPALAAIGSGAVRTVNLDGTVRVRMGAAWLGVALVLAVVIGFRFEVGGDWFNYFQYIFRSNYLTYADLLHEQDPGYMALNILSGTLGWGMTGVNVMGGTIFAVGLVVFVRSLPRPWLGLACAIPYLVIVVGMGYSRQGIALAFVMVALVALRREKFLRFVFWVALGALFHKSSVLIIPIAILTAERARLQVIGLVGVVGYAAYDALLSNYADGLVNVYINQQVTESEGAFIRLAMNAVPATLFLIFRRSFVMAPPEHRLWNVMSWISIAMFLALLGTSFSTALDRMALYLIPLQLVIFSHLPDAMGRKHGRNTAIVGVVLFYFAAVQFVWLNFAVNSRHWIPYKIGLSLNYSPGE